MALAEAVNRSSPSHSSPVEIEPGDIDFMGHVNNASYLTWVQAVVLEHWRRIAPADAVEAHRWIALRHEIIYRKPAFLGDAVIASTQVERVQRESAFFETIFRRDGEMLAEVRSRWCCLDAATLQPTRIPAQIAMLFLG